MNEKVNSKMWLKLIGVDYYINSKKPLPETWSLPQKFSNILLHQPSIIQYKKVNPASDLANQLPKQDSNIQDSDKKIVQQNLSSSKQNQLITSKLTENKIQLPNNMDNTSHAQVFLTENSLKTAREIADSVTSLAELKQAVNNFTGCSLKHFAQNTVFCDGKPNADIMLIGEAPGANEDKIGIPFCGESGKLLDNMLATIGLSRRKNAYITNTVFWRPPANRTPTQEEIDICRPFVEKHIYFINPKLIILVGSTAATSLLGKHAGVTKIRQTYYQYKNQYLEKEIPLTAIFHPAYLLRQPLQKKTSWYDLLKIQDFIRQKGISSN